MATRSHHAEWLSLVEVSGPFLTMPVLERVFPQGLDAHDPAQFGNLRLAFEEWAENQGSRRPNPALYREWIKYVLRQTLEFPDEVLAEGQAIPDALKASIAEHGETLRPDFLVRNPEDISPSGKARLLIQVYPPEQNLDKPVEGKRWKASPATRMMELLHSAEIPLGLITNGEHWMMVYAPRGETTGYASWYASLWLEEKITLQAFRSLLGVRRFFSVPEDETLEAMLAESAKHQQEVTDQLGYQVRRAVEVLIQSLDAADYDQARSLLADVSEAELYESALTVMMRLVFLFCAEERELLLLGDPLYDQHYAVSTLVSQLQEAADQHGEEVLERRRDAWVRLLSTFRAVYGGIDHDRMKLMPYGGRLFDPDRFPFLEGRRKQTKWRETPANPIPVNNRTVLHLLRSLQYLEMGGESRRLSFRALDIEQIGHVYEGLLDHTAKRAAEPVLGLIGQRGDEPEVPLSVLESHLAKGEDELLKFLKEQTKKAEKTLQRALDAELEPDELDRIRVACGKEREVFKRIEPFAGLIRNDSFDRPVVIFKGSFYVTAGTDRRSSGTHYTPRSLTEPIVQYTLEPLVYEGPAEGWPKEEWKLRSPRELLDLKICDMACGSGAFLVQACRYLSALLVEAWEREEAAHPGLPGITPEGAPSTGKPGESLIPRDTAERLTFAQRLVAQRCLYGVDKNRLAVEMAKLSLWLLTLAKNKPFNFLDHAIRPGDSLIGIHDLDQIRYFTLDLEDKQKDFFTDAMEKAVEEVIELRRRIESRPADSVEDAEVQQRLLEEAEAKSKRLGYAADFLIAVEFREGNQSQKEDWRMSAALQANQYLAHDSTEEFEEAAEKALRSRRTFHWPLEFPEVFVGRGGFDAFACNPPFIGGKKITGNLGNSYRDFLIEHIASGAKGNADLSAYFFLQAKKLLRSGGCFGMLATNTIAQGDTREVGLDQITEAGGLIYRAVPSRPWPGTASLEVAEVWIRNNENWRGKYSLEDQSVIGITPYLTRPGRATGKPYRLAANANKSFQGSIVLGMGFVLTPEEAKELIAKDKRNRDVLFPYLNGEDLNSRPDQSPSRWVINFQDWPFDRSEKGSWFKADEKQIRLWLQNGRVPKDYPDPVAADYPDCLKILEKKVKPERTRKKPNGEFQLRYPLYLKWWIYADKRPALYSTIAGMERVLVKALVSPTWAFANISGRCVYDQKIVVLCDNPFALLQSSIHWCWAINFGSTLGAVTYNYTPTDCFENFPFPDRLDTLNNIGSKYEDHRFSIMQGRNEGLTKTHNRLHNIAENSSDILALRKLQVDLDNVVVNAYGWSDIKLGHDFHETKQGIRFTISDKARREVLDRLLELNHQRYAEEVAQGPHEKKQKTGKVAKGRARRSAKTPGNLSLFGDDDDESEAASKPRKQSSSGKLSPGRNADRNKQKKESKAAALVTPTPVDSLETNEVMALIRKVTRGRGWMSRYILIKDVSVELGYQRMSLTTEGFLLNHLRTAVRRGIVISEKDQVRSGPELISLYEMEHLREIIKSVMRLYRNYEREDVVRAVAEYLGFSRVTDQTRQTVRSAISSAIRHGILMYNGEVIWRLK